MNPLFVDVSDLLRSIGSEKRIKKTVELAPFKYYQKELSFVEPLDVDIVLRNVGNRLLAKGCIKGKIWLECNRCLKLFSADFYLNIEESFCTPEQRRNEEEAFEIIDKRIDLYSLIDQGLLLWLPMKQLCRVDCKGLCSMCGKNLNEGSCNCQKDEIDPRLRTLKDFFKK